MACISEMVSMASFPCRQAGGMPMRCMTAISRRPERRSPVRAALSDNLIPSTRACSVFRHARRKVLTHNNGSSLRSRGRRSNTQASRPDRLMNSRTGVYVGMCTNDFLQLQLETRDLGLLDAHFSSGIAHSIASGRLSYLLGLQGPSITIDTACSSGLVAVHYACQSLRTGECRMAIAGGRKHDAFARFVDSTFPCADTGARWPLQDFRCRRRWLRPWRRMWCSHSQAFIRRRG